MEAVTRYYYIDKTLLIRDFIDALPKVSLFSRPRRFGKTLNMDMLRVFFERSEQDTSVYFQDKAIWACGDYYRSFQGKYPVIYLSFKDVKYASWENALKDIAAIIRSEYARHGELLDSPACNTVEKQAFRAIIDDQADEVALSRSLSLLSAMLCKHYGIETVIIIDEYDTPIQQGYASGYYDQVVAFVRNLFSGAFKDNSSLAYGFMTGILRVAKESIFSGMNNLKVNTIMDDRYSAYFGFSKEEVAQMLAHYGHADKLAEVCEWYDGYQFGSSEIYNPWSVINYVDENCYPKAFWQSTGSNEIIGDILAAATPEPAQADAGRDRDHLRGHGRDLSGGEEEPDQYLQLSAGDWVPALYGDHSPERWQLHVSGLDPQQGDRFRLCEGDHLPTVSRARRIHGGRDPTGNLRAEYRSPAEAHFRLPDGDHQRL